MRLGIIYLTFLTLFSCSPKRIDQDYFTVQRVIAGNTLELVNGYHVKLIGIGKDAINRDYLNSLRGKKIKFQFDSRSPFKRLIAGANDKSFFAYATDANGQCVNSELLKKGAPLVIHPYLNDSLFTFIAYSGDREPTPNRNNNQPEPESTFGSRPENILADLIEACDYYSPTTRNFAVKNAGRSPGEYNIGQVISIYDAIRPPNWKYVNDPRSMEFFAKASQTINDTNLTGDCDDFAILMYSLIEAIGGKCRITFAWNENFGHAFTEVDISGLGKSEISRAISRRFNDYKVGNLNYRSDSEGEWLNLDWWAAYPGGEYMDYDQYVIFYPSEDRYSN